MMYLLGLTTLQFTTLTKLVLVHLGSSLFQSATHMPDSLAKQIRQTRLDLLGGLVDVLYK